MADLIATQGIHHLRLTVSNVDRTVTFFTEVLGFKKLMDLKPGAFLSNGQMGLGIGHHPDPGLDHLSFGVASRADLEHAVRVLDQRAVAHSEIRDLGPAFGIYVLIFRDPDNIQLELSAPHAV